MTRATRLRGALGAALRHHPEDTTAHDALRREIRTAKAEEYIRTLLNEDPPLTNEQRSGLAALLMAERDDRIEAPAPPPGAVDVARLHREYCMSGDSSGVVDWEAVARALLPAHKRSA